MTRNVHDFFANWNLFPSDNTMNELRLQYSLQIANWKVVDPNSYTIDRPSGKFGKNAAQPQRSTFWRYELIDNFSLYIGQHSIKTGFDYSYAPWFSYMPQNIPGRFVFNTDLPFDANVSATYPYRFEYAVGDPSLTIRPQEFGIFVQDSWRIHSRLTLNVGLRYNIFKIEPAKIAIWDIRNLNPRFGFSWDPVGDGKTSVRGGIGTYSANPSADPITNIAKFGQVEQRIIVNPNYPDPFAPNPFFTPKPGSVTSIVYDSGDLIAPYTFQTTLGIEREVFTDFSVSADLVLTKGYHLFHFDQLNPVIPGTSLTRVNPAYGDWFRMVDTGKSDYKGLLLTLNKRFSHKWGFNIAYTLSKSMTDTESDSQTPVNYDDLENKRMWGPSSVDARHRLSVTGIVELPWAFQLSGLFYYSSATPWTPIYSTDVNKDGLVSDYVDSNRNSRRGFDFLILNLRLSKIINLKWFRLQILAEGFNITNKANFGGIYDRYATATFGMPTTADDPRQFQVGLRFDF